MIKVVSNSTIEIRAVKDTVFSINKGSKSWYLFGIRLFSRQSHDKFGDIVFEEEYTPIKGTIGFKEKK